MSVVGFHAGKKVVIGGGGWGELNPVLIWIVVLCKAS